MYRDNELTIRQIEEQDLLKLWELIYKEDAPELKKWDAPYFPHKSMPYEQFIEKMAANWIGEDDFWVITIEIFITYKYDLNRNKKLFKEKTKEEHFLSPFVF
ncbi:hypothetical protein [Bacillus sp. SD088]|uniref:hypothetical protein n=1 Tax=Bacillus sp. SD088 TaxID=2782012 RepID=UPI001A96EC37|nr:hypothetical protein [Bacillus sp. SD088]MBO0993035.1 hypothetical protein [Bacillus sp. SD088]